LKPDYTGAHYNLGKIFLALASWCAAIRKAA
jgi:hypothetical protein